MTYPHLLIREAIVFMILVISLVTIALFWDAPLEQLANPLLTPNPAKAPWYFLGLQELLHYFHSGGDRADCHSLLQHQYRGRAALVRKCQTNIVDFSLRGNRAHDASGR